MEPIYEQRAQVFKALCDPRRQKILALLQSGEKCACKLIEEMEMPQSSLSYHMKILCASGIVVGREEGKWTHYRIDPAGSRRAVELLQAITSTDAASSASCTPFEPKFPLFIAYGTYLRHASALLYYILRWVSIPLSNFFLKICKKFLPIM